MNCIKYPGPKPKPKPKAQKSWVCTISILLRIQGSRLIRQLRGKLEEK